MIKNTVICDGCNNHIHKNDSLYELDFNFDQYEMTHLCSKCITKIAKIFKNNKSHLYKMLNKMINDDNDELHNS